MAYEKQTWVDGEVITQEKLNHMEDGIANAGGGGGVTTDLSAIFPAFVGWGNDIKDNVELLSIDTGNSQWFAYFVVSNNNTLVVDDIWFATYCPAPNAPIFASKGKATSGQHLWLSNTVGSRVSMSSMSFYLVNYNNNIICILNNVHSDISAEDAVQKGYELLESSGYDTPYFVGLIKHEFFSTN